MKFEKFIKNIRFYATISFILPLIAINGCLFLYKLIGKIEIHAHYDYSKEIIKLTQNEYNKILFESTKHTFVNCPKYFYADFAIANGFLISLLSSKSFSVNVLKYSLNITAVTPLF